MENLGCSSESDNLISGINFDVKWHELTNRESVEERLWLCASPATTAEINNIHIPTVLFRLLKLFSFHIFFRAYDDSLSDGFEVPCRCSYSYALASALSVLCLILFWVVFSCLFSVCLSVFLCLCIFYVITFCCCFMGLAAWIKRNEWMNAWMNEWNANNYCSEARIP